MISAAEARYLAKYNIWQLQLEQIERGIQDTIIMGGNCVYFKTSELHDETISYLKALGYKIQAKTIGPWNSQDTEISREDEE